MCIVFNVYDISRMVNKVLDVLCPQLTASKHFDRIAQDRLNNILMAGARQGEGLYLIMDREGDYVCGFACYYSPPPNKRVPRDEAVRAIPTNDLNSILVGLSVAD